MDGIEIDGPDPLTEFEVDAEGEGEGEGASISLSEIEIEGLERPKVVDWDDLQQELGRLLSLSSELANAKERKAALAGRLESFLQVRKESLCQSNELEEMRQKLEARKWAMGEMTMRTKKVSEDLEKQRGHLCSAIRLLLVAGRNLSAAHEKLQEANRLLAGKGGYGRLKSLQKMLRMRQQYMISQVNTLYPVKSLNEQISAGKIDSCSSGNSSGDSAASALPKSALTILGQQLAVLPVKKLGFFGDKKEVQRSATVLGYVAHAVLLIGSYLDVPLRYPLRLGGSRSYVLDYAPSSESTSSDLALNPMITNAKPTEFPLFLEGQDTTRAAYAIFLLNKDLEQLLNYIGAESLGPRHVLANLKELMRIVQSRGYIDM